MSKRKVPVRLASARAYWRLAAKSERAGDYKTGKHWRSVGDRLYQQYQRDQEGLARIEQGRRS